MLSKLFAKKFKLKNLIDQGLNGMQNANNGAGSADYKRMIEEISDPLFNEKYFVKFIKCFGNLGGLDEEYKLKNILEEAKNFPARYKAEKNLKEHYEKFDFKNKEFLEGALKYDEIYPLLVERLKEPWIKDKFIEANIAAVLLVGLHPKHKIDYSDLIKIQITEETREAVRLILWAFLNITLKIWETEGLRLSDGSRAILIYDMVVDRYHEYIDNSLNLI